MNVSDDEVRTFVEEMVDIYEENSPVGKQFSHQQWKNAFNKGNRPKFNKFGQWISNVPKKIFVPNSSHHPGTLQRDFINNIVMGEKRHLLTTLHNKDNVDDFDLNGFTYNDINSILSNVQSPTDLYLPMKTEYFREAANSLQNPDEMPFINTSIDIHWESSDHYKNGFLINKDRMRVYQMHDGDGVPTPRSNRRIAEYSDLTKGTRLVTRFAEGKDPDNFEFLYSSVISDPQVQGDNAAAILNLP